MKKIIFHYPGPFYKTLDGGEKKRPFMMCQAFEELGYEVYKIIGTRKERRQNLSKIIENINNFDFIYSENSTLPLALCGKYHLPAFFSPDYELFRIAYKKEIPIGVFYRDIFWKYSEYKKQIGMLKYLFSIPFYKSELSLYTKYCRKIFFPSHEVSDLLPSVTKQFILPPAENMHKFVHKSKSKTLDLIYVGSIAPPKYNLSLLFNLLLKINSSKVKLTLITRKNEWNSYKKFYKIPQCVKFIEADGDNLSEYYNNSDIALLCFNPDEYMQIALPQKLFEAIGYGKPIISFGNTAASRFIKKK